MTGSMRRPSVAVIGREQIDRNPPRHAADMLEQSAGVYTAVSQQDPGLSVNIRGLQDYGRVNMNIDGMRQNFQQSGHQQRNGTMYIDPELLSAVTIEKGATSGMGGAGVIGGVAEFSTLDAREFIHPGKEFGAACAPPAGSVAMPMAPTSSAAAPSPWATRSATSSSRPASATWATTIPAPTAASARCAPVRRATPASPTASSTRPSPTPAPPCARAWPSWGGTCPPTSASSSPTCAPRSPTTTPT